MAIRHGIYGALAGATISALLGGEIEDVLRWAAIGGVGGLVVGGVFIHDDDVPQLRNRVRAKLIASDHGDFLDELDQLSDRELVSLVQRG
jgi:hypothetical protein